MATLTRRMRNVEQIFTTQTMPVADLLRLVDDVFTAVRDTWGFEGVARIEEQTNSFLLPLRAGDLQEAERQARARKATYGKR